MSPAIRLLEPELVLVVDVVAEPLDELELQPTEDLPRISELS